MPCLARTARAVALAVVGSACGPAPYHPPSVAPANQRSLGCLDLTFAVSRDARVPARSLLLRFHLGNRCFRSVPLDLSALRCEARDREGGVVPLVFHDPKGEIQPLRVDPVVGATELIRLDPRPEAPIADPVTVCFDLAHITPDATPEATSPLCVRVTEGGS